MGIATALKLFVLRAARRRGVKRVVTDNEEKKPHVAYQPYVGFQTPPCLAGLVPNS